MASASSIGSSASVASSIGGTPTPGGWNAQRLHNGFIS